MLSKLPVVAAWLICHPVLPDCTEASRVLPAYAMQSQGLCTDKCHKYDNNKGACKKNQLVLGKGRKVYTILKKTLNEQGE